MKLSGISQNIGVAGFAISFIGTLPFGVLNVLAFFIALSESFLNAVLFALGVISVELMYVFLTLFGSGFFRLNTAWKNRVHLLMLVLVVVIACTSLLDALSNQPLQPVLPNDIPRFFLGIGLSGLNALQIPFWVGWNIILLDKGVLHLKKPVVIRYLAGIGTGTFAGLLVFMLAAFFVGREAIVYIGEMKLAIACVLFGTAGFMGWKLLFRRDLRN
jgi:hypothetical protein